MSAGLLALLLGALAHPALAQDPAQRQGLLEALAAEDPQGAAAAWRALLAHGDAAAAAALRRLGSGRGLDLRGRRRLAAFAAAAGGPAAAREALALLGDADPKVRGELAALLGKRELRGELAPERSAALEGLARADLEAAVRAAAVAALGRVDDGLAVQALERLARDLLPEERLAAARALADHPLGRETVVRLVQRGVRAAGGEAAGVPADVLAALLGGPYGTALAELPSGGDGPADLATLVLGAQHPAPQVRAAVEPALDQLVARLRFLGDLDRAERALAALLGQGLDDEALLARRARLLLETGRDPPRAERIASELAARARAGAFGLEARRRLGQAGLLRAAAALASGEAVAAEEPLAEARAAFEGLVAERLDRASSRGADHHADLLERAALVELYEALRRLLQGLDAGDPRVLEPLRRAHLLSLRAQLAASASAWSGLPGSLDALLVHRLGPAALVLAPPPRPALPRGRALELWSRLGSALASVAPLEVPGFERAQVVEPRLASPFADVERLALLQRLQSQQIQAVRERLRVLGRELRRSDPQRDLGESLEWRATAAWLEALLAQQRRDPDDGYRGLWALRSPSDTALDLAEALREDGRTAAARELVARLLADLERAEQLAGSAWSELLAARAEVASGSAWMDDGEPRRARELFEKALARVETVEREVEARQGEAPLLAQLRSMRASVLVSLAVNANVKLREPERALEWFERAFELREDDFMRVLLACYRARAGREAEARAVLREVPVSPGNFYNLACTYALLGERELALDFLQRDFAELRTSPGALERQQQWARGDPDLESLRGDPRFEALLAPRPAPSGGH